MYGWYNTLTELETDSRLQGLHLSDEITKTLRAVPWAYGQVLDEVKAESDAYLRVRGDGGGWAQLGVIIDWTFFLSNWRLLMQRGAREREVVDAIRAIAPGRTLLPLSRIRAMPARSHDS